MFVNSPPVQVATADVACQDKALRSRTIVLVDISDDDCYALSLERVRGGTEHRWSFHGPDGEATPSGVQLTPRGCTILGEDVAYGDTSDLPAGDRELACLAFMYDPQTAHPEGVWSLDYMLRDQDNVHLRMTVVEPNDAELTVARGKAPGGRSDYEMTWTILRRQGSEQLSSQYLCVLEPYENERVVKNIEKMSVTSADDSEFPPLAIRVVTDEYTDTIILQNDSNSVCQTADGLVCHGEFGFWREKSDGSSVAVLANGNVLSKEGTELRQPEASYTGVIESCDFRNFEVKVTPAPDDIASLAGKHLHIHNDAGNAASYLIEEARPDAGGCILTLELDPRIGEGFVRGSEDGCLVSGTHLRMARFSYYAGKTLANEDHSTIYRLSDVENGSRCQIHEATHGRISADTLSTQFSDRDGDGLSRFLIYDYGPGDSVTIKNFAAL
jgi:hypothetical protein